MITPSDDTYQETRRIMLGQASLNPEFRPLAEWIDKSYGVRTINIIYDTIENGKRPGLEICFESESEKDGFRNPATYLYDREKQQAIAENFKETILEQGLAAKYLTEDIWVIFDAFERVARVEAVESIPEEKVAELKRQLKNPDLWTISRFNGVVTFFLYTDGQVKRYAQSTVKKEWADRSFDLIKSYDTFGYFSRDAFDIYLDSKENFDTNYSSNWFYYYK